MSGSAVEDAVLARVEHLFGNTYRYFFSDRDPTNSADAFKNDLFHVLENGSNTKLTLNFPAGAWKDTTGLGNALTSVTIDVRWGPTVADANIELGPLVLNGPYFNLEELQVLPLPNPADGSSLITQVALAVDEASLKFGSTAGGATDKVQTKVTGLQGTFTIDQALNGAGHTASSSVGFQIRADSVELEVKDIVKASATGIVITYDPLIDVNHDGTITAEEQKAYDEREIVRIDTARVEIPKINLAGNLNRFTLPSPGKDPNTGLIIPGKTIPGLSVRNNGFRLGEASLQYTGEKTFGESGFLTLKGLKAGVQNFGVTFGEQFEFDGNVFIAADEATLFPNSPKFKLSIRDTTRDPDTEAVRATLKFVDNVPAGFAFKADQADFKIGSFLELRTDTFVIDTTATGINPVVSFGQIGQGPTGSPIAGGIRATVAAGPLKLSGEMRNFGFLRDGSIKTFGGFGVFFGAETVNTDSFKWPTWLPIQVGSVGIQWRDLNNDPADFRLVLSAGVKDLPIRGLKVSGAIQGLEIDLGLLVQGKFPITAIQSFGVTAAGTLFGGDFTGGLIGGIVPFDANGNEVPAGNQTTPIVDRVLFIGLQGGFKLKTGGGFTLRMALTDNGPLGVQLTGQTGDAGILLEPISGLKLIGFSGGIEFFKSPGIPDAKKPDDGHQSRHPCAGLS